MPFCLSKRHYFTLQYEVSLPCVFPFLPDIIRVTSLSYQPTVRRTSLPAEIPFRLLDTTRRFSVTVSISFSLIILSEKKRQTLTIRHNQTEKIYLPCWRISSVCPCTNKMTHGKTGRPSQQDSRFYTISNIIPIPVYASRQKPGRTPFPLIPYMMKSAHSCQ